ncbi:hypothetical protein ACFVHS_33010 [Streptomyces sp. NPDC057746]|uniref:MmyB family transcriptional regulator n=1 Tax=Streptomyces sp. NPDC057746 TaxID=3346237 RepID=UPI00367D73BA
MGRLQALQARHGHGKKRIFHETVGEMTLNYETLDISGSDGQFLSTYTADVGSPSDENLRLLISWDAALTGTTPVTSRRD